MVVAYRHSPNQLNSYRTQSVLGLTPAQLVLKLYDMAVAALLAREGDRASKVLAQLIESLDFQQRDVALGMFRLYRYCLEQIKRGEYEVPTTILRELRNTWAQALASAVGDTPGSPGVPR